MPDSIGRISVPSPVDSGSTFPLKPDYGYSFSQDRPIITHQFGSGDTKIEQRFEIGIGPRRFTFRRAVLSYADRRSLRDFYDSMQGSWKSFNYAAPNAARTTDTVKVNFEYAPLGFSHLAAACSSGCTFVEAFDPASAPSYSVSSTVTRFPSSGLSSALLSQVQRIIPLLHIRVREAAVPDIYLSDRRVTVGGQLYLPRLQNIGEPGSDTLISQSISGAADNVQVLLANADRVISQLANDTDLRLASIDLSLFHVQSTIKLQLWKGFITDFVNDGSPSFALQCSDGLYQVMQQYPLRTLDRQCWKEFNDGLNCPYIAQSTNHGGDPTSCDFYFSSTNGCKAHGMDKFFGAHPAQPQTVAGLAQIIHGLRDNPTSTSIVTDTAWGNVLQEVYCNDGGTALKSFPVPCLIVAGRDENEFYDALGVIGQGPIGEFTGMQVVQNADGFRVVIAPMLDGQPPHGFQVNSQSIITSNTTLGLRLSVGNDPNPDPFNLSQLVGGDTTARAAGTAFAEIRRTDAPGIQPTTTDQHTMTIPVSKGLAGYTWDSGGNRSLTPGLINPFWIAVNSLLRATGTFQADSATQLGLFDLASLTNGSGSGVSDIANLSVPALVGGGSETQFTFQGTLAQQKPFRDWLNEILSCCLGYYTFDFGKLRLGIRENASATDAFTIGNILFQSLRLQPFNAQFERLEVNFADAAYQFQRNTATYSDKSHAAYMSRSGAPLTARMQSVGGASLSQMLRVAATRVREEIGGITAAEWRAARLATFSTTVLALSTAVGQVVSMTHDDMPGGVGKFRITQWRLKKDWSIEISGKTVTSSMYDLTAGPKPLDVTPDPLPPIFYPIPFAPAWAPFQVQAASNDALFPDEWNFISDQQYTTLANGNPSAALVCTGKLPVTAFISGCPPPEIGSISVSSSGGSIPGGTTWRVTICAFDSTGKSSPPALIAIVQIPTGTNTNSISLADIIWPAITGLSSYGVFASDQDELICSQQSGSLTGGPVYTPGSITVTGPFLRSTWALPTPFVSRVRLKAKILRHSGILGAGVTSVSANTIVSADCSDGSGSPLNMTGRIISIIGRPIGATPFASFLITAHVPATGTFTVSPNPVGIVQALDAFVVRNKAAAANPSPFTSITDTGYRNSLNAYGGLATNFEVGSILRVIAGKGRGQLRKITANTDVDLSWDVPLELDSTSVWILEENAYIWQADTTDAGNADHLKATIVSVPAENMLEQPALICGFTVDINGVESPDGNNPCREDWVFGAQSTRIVTADTDMLQTDGLVIFDTSVNNTDITYQCLPAAQLPNRIFIWQRRSPEDGKTVYIQAAAGDAFDAALTTTLTLTKDDETGTIQFKFYG